MNWFHRHGPWDVAGAYCDRQTHYTKGPSGVFGYFAVTNIAMRCGECGEVKSKSIPGWYSAEQLRGESSEVAKVLKELER